MRVSFTSGPAWWELERVPSRVAGEGIPKMSQAVMPGSPEMLWPKPRTYPQRGANAVEGNLLPPAGKHFPHCQRALLAETGPDFPPPRRAWLMETSTQPKYVFLFTNLWSRNKNFHSKLCLEVNSSKGLSTMHISCIKRKKAITRGARCSPPVSSRMRGRQQKLKSFRASLQVVLDCNSASVANFGIRWC